MTGSIDRFPGADAGASAPPLARTRLDRAAHRRTDPSWLAAAERGGRLLVVDTSAGGRALVTGSRDRPELVLLDSDSLPGPAVAADSAGAADPVGPAVAVGPAAGSGRTALRLFLGVEPDGVAVFAVDGPLPELPNTRAMLLRQVGHLLTERDAGLFTTAVALANWHARHPYSATSGLPTTVTDAGWSRVDPDGAHTWPRTDPAMIVLVNDGVAGPAGRCLLGSNAAWPPTASGLRRYSCLAGYVEPGESAEAAVLREVAEEVGVTPTQIEYVSSQSWPYPGSLMLGFFARADPDQPLRLDPAEMADARWFTRQEVAAFMAEPPGTHTERPGTGAEPPGVVRLPPPSSIAFFLIERWLRG